MRKPFLVVLIGLAAALVAEFHLRFKPQPSKEELQQFSQVMSGRNKWQGKLAPDFELVTMRGDRFRFSEEVGKRVIVLNFFATWCGPCRDEMEELNRYYQDHRNGPFLLLAVDAEEKPDRVNDYVKENNLAFPVSIDDGRVEKRYGVSGFPTTVLIGVDGRVQLYEVGALPNADVAFNTFLPINQKLLSSGQAMTTEAYLKQSGQVSQRETGTTADDKEAYILDARAKRIATNMDCPCGCDKRVDPCDCHTSRKIKKALAAGGFGQKSDVDITRELNRRYCMAGM